MRIYLFLVRSYCIINLTKNYTISLYHLINLYHFIESQENPSEKVLVLWFKRRVNPSREELVFSKSVKVLFYLSSSPTGLSKDKPSVNFRKEEKGKT